MDRPENDSPRFVPAETKGWHMTMPQHAGLVERHTTTTTATKWFAAKLSAQLILPCYLQPWHASSFLAVRASQYKTQ